MRELQSTVKEVLLQRLDFYAHNSINYRELARSIKVETSLEPFLDGMVVRFLAQFAGETVPEVDVTFPVTWWDAFKDRWFPKWSRRWAPVQYRRVEANKHTLFPSIQIPDQRHVVIRTVSDHKWLERDNEE